MEHAARKLAAAGLVAVRRLVLHDRTARVHAHRDGAPPHAGRGACGGGPHVHAAGARRGLAGQGAGDWLGRDRPDAAGGRHHAGPAGGGGEGARARSGSRRLRRAGAGRAAAAGPGTATLVDTHAHRDGADRRAGGGQSGDGHGGAATAGDMRRAGLLRRGPPPAAAIPLAGTLAYLRRRRRRRALQRNSRHHRRPRRIHGLAGQSQAGVVAAGADAPQGDPPGAGAAVRREHNQPRSADPRPGAAAPGRAGPGDMGSRRGALAVPAAEPRSTSCSRVRC